MPGFRSNQSFVIAFVALAFAISWLCWLPLALAGVGCIDVQPPAVLQFVGALGPAIAAVVVSARDAAAWSRFRSRLRGPRIWVIAGTLVPCAVFASVGSVMMFVTGFVGYGIGEELGWRGLLLPRLQRTRSATSASLVVAVIWAAWHIPLFAFAASMTKLGGGEVVAWAVSLVSASFLLTWFTNASRGVFAAVVFHGVFSTVMTSSINSKLQMALGLAVMVAGFTIPFRVRAPKLAD